MTDRIKQLASDALNGIDKFEKGSCRLKDVSELKSPIKIAEGLDRFFSSVPVKQYDGEKLYGRLRFDGCEYPADLYRRVGHNSYNRYWNTLCTYSPTPTFYWGWTQRRIGIKVAYKDCRGA